MYLSKIKIKGFRGITESTIEFHKGLNVLIGENNSGKSSIVDALRICLGIGYGYKDIYLDLDDFHINHDGVRQSQIGFDLFFIAENDYEIGMFYELLSLSNPPRLEIHMVYEIREKNGVEKPKLIKFYGGENEGQTIPWEIHDRIGCIYLGALRDSEKDLRPGRGNKLADFFSRILPGHEDQEKKASTINDLFKGEKGWLGLISKGSRGINEQLGKTSLATREQNIEIDFFPLNFRKIVESLRIRLKHTDSAFFEIEQNGLGYNNIIYIAIILGDLIEKRIIDPQDYMALLIEEPEAHLHPQLQNVLFNFFNEIEDKFQIFITSHSPTITAKASLDKKIILTKSNNKTRSFALRNSVLEPVEVKKITRFLDVTKSQLFYAQKVILVEGISEALLLPVFSILLDENFQTDKYGIEIVNINGVAFEPFAKLFNNENECKRIDAKCVILTDQDNKADNTISDRANKATQLQGGNLRVYTAYKTFEYELFNADNKNITIIKKVYKMMHPSTEIGDVEDFIKKLNSNKDKAEFAQELASELYNEIQSGNCEFKVPKYIKEALEWVRT